LAPLAVKGRSQNFFAVPSLLQQSLRVAANTLILNNINELCIDCRLILGKYPGHRRADMGTQDFESQLRGMRLTTAEITYRMPDFRDILQTYIWQEYDLAPRFPKLIKFLDFWSHNLEGPLAAVRVAQVGFIAPAELRYVGYEWRLH
jgi:uncharacterized protein Usg